MKYVIPKVYHIGKTVIIREGLEEYLRDCDLTGWITNAPTEAEELIEFYGRLCYDSFQIGKNLNVSKIREGNDVYLANISASKHGSVTEHAMLNFVFKNVSKVFTEELVRHRVGVAISGESGRYVRRNEVEIWVPDILTENHPYMLRILQFMLYVCDRWILYSAEKYGLDDAKVPFSRKKQLTSAIRRFLPIGKASTMGWSANFRALHHVLNMRTSPGAEEEMVLIFNQVGEICLNLYPNIFADVKKIPIPDTTYFHYQS